MAILESVPGIEVQVLVRGQPLQEYGDNNSPDVTTRDPMSSPVICKYIESTDNAEFAIFTKVPNYTWGYRNHMLFVSIYIDGNWVSKKLIHPPVASIYHLDTQQVYGKTEFNASTKSSFLRRFKFAAVHTVDNVQNERIAQDIEHAKKLGTIEVKLYRVTEGGVPKVGLVDAVFPTSEHSGDFELAEKSLKGRAISHGTSYQTAQPIQTSEMVAVTKLPEDKGPMATYKFLYRSKEALRRELIVPRSPARSPTLQGLTDAERDRLALERLNELQKVKEEGKVLKRERDETEDLTGEKDGIAPRPWPVKRTRLSSGRIVDVLDLTGN
ncbi:hypothetical protein F4809DRAFT_653298 [Biscogniauxia mediterranea]|nr:hypothetical protein F4809DRAFT_653298 [Biscogniauxia mediterranea]